MLGFTRSLAREVGRFNVTVNAVAPGFMDTDMTQSLNEGHRAQIARRSALQRLVDVEDVAVAVSIPDERCRPQHHRHGDGGGCRQYGVVATGPFLLPP